MNAVSASVIASTNPWRRPDRRGWHWLASSARWICRRSHHGRPTRPQSGPRSLAEGELMARLRRASAEPTSDRFDLGRAFRYLGRGPSYRQLDAVVKRLHDAGVKELDNDEELDETAEANGSMSIVALDLQTAFYFGVETLYAGPKQSTREGP